jgi:hypothetical protein
VDVDKTQKILKSYLRPFYCQPETNSERLRIMREKLDICSSLLAFSLSSVREIKQVAQFYLLSAKKRLFWKAFNVFDLVNIFLDKADGTEFGVGGSVVSVTSEFPVIVIYQTGAEVGGQKLDPLIDNLVNQIIAHRTMYPHFRTLFLTLVSHRGFVFNIENLFSSDVMRTGGQY